MSLSLSQALLDVSRINLKRQTLNHHISRVSVSSESYSINGICLAVCSSYPVCLSCSLYLSLCSVQSVSLVLPVLSFHVCPVLSFLSGCLFCSIFCLPVLSVRSILSALSACLSHLLSCLFALSCLSVLSDLSTYNFFLSFSICLSCPVPSVSPVYLSYLSVMSTCPVCLDYLSCLSCLLCPAYSFFPVSLSALSVLISCPYKEY